ncbi:rhodanese-like domain-containing protein [Siminovitchia fortis]|uniref:Rhodanese-like domain-containing protein n=1 Tax=Siminovitchia fortis TaxID=254758 RepID=A0A443ISJ5_9BACI|nr:rhodanese-like domain-containing protein [Siminovitchia fortis]RWR09620.1 rhodanese-like domain-containing protein [Siminovitchia fortis]WHY82241.1 rhodanese-like domain-containing protein [Siminovitchia fortis]
MEIKTITPDEVKTKLENGETLFLVDVRDDEEVAEGMIPEAVHIRMGEIPEHLDYFDKENDYILICRSGGRSQRVCEYLAASGFPNVVNMTGGMLAWTGELKPKQ